MTDEDVLDALVARWEDACDRGERLTAEELAGDRTDLVPVLARRIAALAAMRVVEPTALGGGRGTGGRDTAPGRLIRGRFRLEERLGGGSEGDVWRAHDTLIHRDVAIKLPQYDGERLLNEARLIASLKHPRILAVLDAGRDEDDTVFVVSELMSGGTLADRIRGPGGGRVPVARAIAWTTQIAAALHAVHLAGRAHRDVKPINILLDGGDHAVLADFGIAIDVAAQAPGSTLGTPAYKSPEQLEGRKLDARSDVYSLALVTHEMLAGSLPFTNPTDPAATEREIRAGVENQVSHRIPARLRPVIRRALARLPANRHESAPQFARELERAWRRSLVGRGLAAAAGVVLVGALGLGWRIRAERRRVAEIDERQMQEVRKKVGEVKQVGDEAQRKVQDTLDFVRRLEAEVMNDTFHRTRKEENEARRRAEEQEARGAGSE